MIDESSLFWLETRDYRHLFPKRVLSQDAIYQHLQEALALSKEQADLRDQDEILQRHQRLDRVLTFLCGDLEVEPKRRITTIYQQMVWSSASLSTAQCEAAARRTAARIDRLRRMQPE